MRCIRLHNYELYQNFPSLASWVSFCILDYRLLKSLITLRLLKSFILKFIPTDDVFRENYSLKYLEHVQVIKRLENVLDV